MEDLNCRTSVKLDYVQNDRFIQSRDSVEEVDTPIQRFSRECGSNKFGDALLEMCLAVSLQIVNGRLCNDKLIGKVTCYTHNGESVVDYLLTSQANFNLISNFKTEILQNIQTMHQ